MSIDRALIEGRKASIAQQLAETPKILDVLYSRGDFARVGINVDVMARALMTRGMMRSRVDSDHIGALEDFRLAAAYTVELEKAVNGARARSATAKSNYLDIGTLEIPMLTCLMSFDIDKSRLQAQLSGDSTVEVREDAEQALMVRLLAALILDDRANFEKYKTSYNAQKKSKWWQYFAIYMDIYESVILREQDRYDALATEAQQAYRARAKDKKFGTLRPEYGGGNENEAMLDFYLVAVAALALKRGMNVNHFSDIVPRELFVAGGLL